MKKLGIILGILFLTIGVSGLLAGKRRITSSHLPINKEQVIVLRAIDGDTIELSDKRRVRYIGINAPEVVNFEKPMECFGKEAKEQNQKLVEGKIVTLESDVVDKDKYNRLLRYVYVDNLMINEELIRRGFAKTEKIAPNVKYAFKLKDLQREAQEKKMGLWSACPS